MSLKTTQVSRCLDKKLTLFGFEVADLLLIFALVAVLNLVVGDFSYSFLLTWLPAALFALVLRIGKRGKPDNYLTHLIRFQFKPGVLEAFHPPRNSNARLK